MDLKDLPPAILRRLLKAQARVKGFVTLYKPHQGARERARRLRQAERGVIRVRTGGQR